jgi:imidazolonepropionase-like amidohydrolase
MWALPGLVDGHSHFARDSMDGEPGDVEGAARRARQALQAGVMLAIDKGWRDLTVIEMMERVGEGQRPDMEAAGIMTTIEGGYYPGFGRIVDGSTFEQGVAAAARESAGWVKLVGDWPRKGVGPTPNFSESQLKTAVRVAGEDQARVAVHTMAREVPSMAVRAGVHSIEHGLFLTEGDLAPLASRGGIWVPTVLNMEVIAVRLGAESSGGKLIAAGLDNISRLLPLAAEAGVHVLAGSDLAVPTDRIGEEAVRMHQLGMSREQAVRAVSVAGYSATGRPHAFEPGSPANAVFYDENPMVDPAVLAHPRMVVRRGAVIR